MGFVNNNNAVTIQISFVKGFTQKDAIGHICMLRQSQGEKRMKAWLTFDFGVRAGTVLKTDCIADSRPQFALIRAVCYALLFTSLYISHAPPSLH